MPKTESLIDSGYPEDQPDPALSTELYELQIAAYMMANTLESWLKLDVADAGQLKSEMVVLEKQMNKVKKMLT